MSTTNELKDKNKGYILWDENVTVTIYEKQLDDILVDEVRICSVNNENNNILIYGLNLLYLADLLIEQKYKYYDNDKRINIGNAEVDIYKGFIVIRQDKIEVEIKTDMMLKLLTIYQEIYNINFDAKKMEKDN